MDLADELLLDLEGDFEEGDTSVLDEEADYAAANATAVGVKRKADEMDLEEDAAAEQAALVEVPEGGVKPAEELDTEEVETFDLASIAEVGKVAKLFNNKAFQDALAVSTLVLLACEKIQANIMCAARKSSTTETCHLQTCPPLNHPSTSSSSKQTTLRSK